jgi:hypothetical protein
MGNTFMRRGAPSLCDTQQSRGRQPEQHHRPSRGFRNSCPDHLHLKGIVKWERVNALVQEKSVVRVKPRQVIVGDIRTGDDSYAWVFFGITAALVMTEALAAPDNVVHFGGDKSGRNHGRHVLMHFGCQLIFREQDGGSGGRANHCGRSAGAEPGS